VHLLTYTSQQRWQHSRRGSARPIAPRHGICACSGAACCGNETTQHVIMPLDTAMRASVVQLLRPVQLVLLPCTTHAGGERHAANCTLPASAGAPTTCSRRSLIVRAVVAPPNLARSPASTGSVRTWRTQRWAGRPVTLLYGAVKTTYPFALPSCNCRLRIP
jgi:hypothetical protein